MLVLSRRVRDTICFPELDITIQILQLKGSTVRVGVDAPLEIAVLRGELEGGSRVERKMVVPANNEHALRNVINSIQIASSLTQALLERGQIREAASALNDALESLSGEELFPTCKALLVEDSDNEREMLAGFLRLHGFTVDSVPDGNSALLYLEENEKPDIILIDMELPGIHGSDVVRQIRQQEALVDVKIFVISGSTPRRSGLNVQKDGIEKWFQKPLQPAELVSTIQETCLAAMSPITVS